MLPSTIMELVFLAIASFQLGGVDAKRKPFTRPYNMDDDGNIPLENRDARRPFTLPTDFEPNHHRKPFTAPPMITGRPVIENVVAAERPVIQDTTDSTATDSER